MLNINKLHKYYNTQIAKLHVLKGISFKIEKGEFVCLIGPSGAGKSTLLHLLGGLDMPSSGEVLLEGVNLYKIKESRRAFLRSSKIGFVFQFYHLLPEFIALENVLFPACILGTNRQQARKKAYDLLAKVGLAERAAHHPSELSGGEQQRVAIARALINQPQILFCDEPTGNLDSRTGDKICQLLLDFNKNEKYTILVATHSEEIAKISTRQIYLKDGEIQDRN